MLQEVDLINLAAPVTAWFGEHQRDLPWRAEPTPYHVWVSEIMLQQTRVEAVKPYYARFMEALPDVPALAACPDDRLMKLWEGLGYYSRARNLKKAAGVIMEQHGGKLPCDYESIRALPGIGPYTAGAIASIAFGLPYPAVDGNVLRVIARVTDDDRDIFLDSTKKDVTVALMNLLQILTTTANEDCKQENETREPASKNAVPQKNANPCGTFNQALMELGALICTPNGAPHCEACPWQTQCLSRQRGTIEALPVRIKKQARRKEQRTVLLIRDGERILIQKRPDKGLLAGLYEFPNIEGHLTKEQVIDTVRAYGLDPLHLKKLPPAKHIFTHIEWQLSGYLIRVATLDAESPLPAAARLAALTDIQTNFAIPSAFEKYASYINLELGPPS